MTSGRYHLIFDLKAVSMGILQNKAGLKRFLKNFPSKIGMKVLKGPVVVEGVSENPGISGFVVIDYSHISIHTFTDSRTALVDVFSCKSYDQKLAKNNILEYFQAKEKQVRTKTVYWGKI